MSDWLNRLEARYRGEQQTLAPAAVIVPYGGTDNYRYRAWRAVLRFYTREFPGWAVYTSSSLQVGSAEFSRAAEVNRLAAQAREPVIVVNDADTLCRPENVMRAYRLAVEKPGLVRAYSRYQRLSRGATDTLFGPWTPEPYQAALSAPDNWFEWEQEPAYAHGCAITRRECFEQVGGYDPKFVGWGYEDCAAELIYDAHFEPDRRVQGDLVHFWHPDAGGGEDSRRNADLYYRLYEPYRGDAAALLAARWMTAEEAGGRLGVPVPDHHAGLSGGTLPPEIAASQKEQSE